MEVTKRVTPQAFYRGARITHGDATESNLFRDRSWLKQMLDLAPQQTRKLMHRPDLLTRLTQLISYEDGEEHIDLALNLSEDAPIEQFMLALRREKLFAASYFAQQFITEVSTREELALSQSELADICLEQMANICARDQASLLESAGVRWALFGLGKLGGQDMTATSDLDLMLVYEGQNVYSRDVAARLTQNIIHAMSSRCSEGALYETDWRLRPDGDDGPVAVSLESFSNYYKTKAWTWEMMSLTRLRPICGDAELLETVSDLSVQLIQERSGKHDVTMNIVDMREKLAKHRTAKSFWDMKLADGGLLDIEFIAQHAILMKAYQRPELIRSNTKQALKAVTKCGILSERDAAFLLEAEEVQATLQQAQRLTGHARARDVDAATDQWGQWFANKVGARSLRDCQAMVSALRSGVRKIRQARFGKLEGLQPE